MLKLVKPAKVIRVNRISAASLKALQRRGYVVLMTYTVKGL